MYYLLLLLFITLYKNSFALQKNGDKIIMQPVELIDLVIQEQMRSDRPAIRRRYKENAKTGVGDHANIEVQTGGTRMQTKTGTELDQNWYVVRAIIPPLSRSPCLQLDLTKDYPTNTSNDDCKVAEDISGDEERLRARKVWSRWGKWSDCSATCGGGMIVRRRLCVAGRCAPGELEEQRRACAESPCTTTSFELGPEDMREVE